MASGALREAALGLFAAVDLNQAYIGLVSRWKAIQRLLNPGTIQSHESF